MEDDSLLGYNQIAAINRTFEEARKPITEHPEKKGEHLFFLKPERLIE